MDAMNDEEVNRIINSYREEWELKEAQGRDIAVNARKSMEGSAAAAVETITNLAEHGRSESIRLKAAMYIADKTIYGEKPEDELAKIIAGLQREDAKAA